MPHQVLDVLCELVASRLRVIVTQWQRLSLPAFTHRGVAASNVLIKTERGKIDEEQIGEISFFLLPPQSCPPQTSYSYKLTTYHAVCVLGRAYAQLGPFCTPHVTKKGYYSTHTVILKR